MMNVNFSKKSYIDENLLNGINETYDYKWLELKTKLNYDTYILKSVESC